MLASDSTASRRVFLDWGSGDGSDAAPLLERAARRLIDDAEGPGALGDTLVALPGARAGRLFLKHLGAAARSRGWKGFFPPRVLTQGRLVDELLTLERPSAHRLTRTLAWERALAEVDADTFQRIARRRPPRADRSAWWRIAEDVRALHAELAVEGHDFESVRRALDGHTMAVPVSEERRWEALAAVQQRWRKSLVTLGLDDPHDGRRAALDGGSGGDHPRVATDARVVLVGVVEVNGLLRRALAALRTPPLAMVFAPEELAAAFDEFGCLRVDAWAEREVPVPLERWHVALGPDDQARSAVASIGAAAPELEFAADLVIGSLDDEVTPYLVRRLGSHGIRARDAAGTPFERTAPARLLDATRRYLESWSAADAASLVRHEDLGVVLAARLGHDPVARLDRYRPVYLPRRVRPAAPDVPNDAKNPKNEDTIEPLVKELAGLFGPLAVEDARPLAVVAADLRVFLESVYADHALLVTEGEAGDLSAEAREDRRELGAALASIGGALAALETVPPAVAGRVTPAAGIGFLLRTAQAGGAIAPAPADEDEPTVELLGWLELLLDDAPHLVLTGFNEGRVPMSPAGDAALPDRVRTLLGIEDERRRQARDVYVANALLASGRVLAIVSGRRTQSGDALFPSRLCFFAPRSEAGPRLDHALAPRRFRPVERDEREVVFPDVVVPREAPDSFSVTSFKTYMESPVLFHLERELRVEPVDDRVGEMNALRFGSLAHDVLEQFGRKGPKESTDEAEILRYLERQLELARAAAFPDDVLPTVPLQLEQLRLRLASFARWQAERAADGWRIRYVEWSPNKDAEERPNAVELEMGAGEPSAWIRGQIDRIEQHVDGRWCVLDYKTSQKSHEPGKQHVASRPAEDGSPVWKDLQLPLYAHMVETLVGKGVVPELGYVNLPGDGSEVECKLLPKWEREMIDSALDAARDVVRAVRRRDVASHGKLRILEPIQNELLGVGLVVPPPSADGDDGAGDSV